ncbi:MAG: efflux RND transporter periplasmic adaptor subunit [Deltaproteobacteria bacterium]|nr:MAG: efflux RND transporter periplasmic adaptor subunit [Deltaproteobacteria bacterium]
MSTKKTGLILTVVIITAATTMALTWATIHTLYDKPARTVLDAEKVLGPDHTAEDHEPGQLYSCGMHPWIISEEPGDCPICGMELTPKRDDTTTSSAPTERKVVYWRAPMDPTEIYEEPGKSKMGMDLVPVYSDELIGGVEVSIDPVTQQNMGVRTAIAERNPLEMTLRTYGRVTYDVTKNTKVSPRFDGWVERLYVEYPGQKIKRGEQLFDIYSPELVGAQEEYLAALRGGEESPLAIATKKKLLNLGVAEREITAIKKRGEVTRTITIRAPSAGVVLDTPLAEGAFVKKGQAVYSLADLSDLWVEATIYEQDIPWVREGQRALIDFPYLPGAPVEATVSFIYPYLRGKTRDVVARLEIDNGGGKLKPEMFGEVTLNSTLGYEGTTIPSEAVIRTGTRNIVFVTRGEGKFTPREVTLGHALSGGNVEVLQGIAPGEEVVTSGQFLLDSESNLKEAVQKMLEARKSGSAKSQKNDDDFFDDMESDDGFFDDMEEGSQGGN